MMFQESLFNHISRTCLRRRSETLKTAIVLYLILLSPFATAVAEEYRTISVFSPIDASRVSSEITLHYASRATGSRRNPDGRLDDLIGAAIDLGVLNSVKSSATSSKGNALSEAVKKPDGIDRRNIVKSNTKQLNDALRAAIIDKKITPILSLDLFDDKHANVVIDTVENAADGGLLVTGWVQDNPGALFTMTTKGSELRGLLRDGNSIYSMTPLKADKTLNSLDMLPFASGPTTVIDQKQITFPHEEPPGAKLIAPAPDKKSELDLPPFPSGGDDPTQPDPEVRIKIAVFYTPQAQKEAAKAQNQAGGDAAIKTLVQASVSLTNASFKLSQINLHADSVYVGKIDYAESGSIELDRNRLQAGQSPWFSDVKAIKNKTQANVVALIIGQSPLYCGISYIPEVYGRDYSKYAVMVVAQQCAAENLSFAHELGHVLGARHDRYADSIDGKPTKGNHGVVYKRGAIYYRDIMAYPQYCGEVLQKDCGRQGLWSGSVWPPGLDMISQSPEDIGDNNQRILRIMGPVVSKYK